MNKMNWTRILTLFMLWGFISLMLVACVPQQGTSGGTRTTASSDSSEEDEDTDTTIVNTQSLFFYTQGTSALDVTVDAAETDNIYLRGSSIEKLFKMELKSGSTYTLPDFTNEEFCFRMAFKISSSLTRELRVRAVPVSLYVDGVRENFFRIELSNKEANESLCSSVPSSGITSANIKYTTEELCASGECSGTFATLNDDQETPVKAIYMMSSLATLIETAETLNDAEVLASELTAPDLTTLTLRVNPENDTVISSCSDSACQAAGYSCCLSGQCVQAGAERPSASNDELFTSIIRGIVSAQPSLYRDYPQYYYVCENYVDPTPTATATTDPVAEADQLLWDSAVYYLYSTCNGDDAFNADLVACSSGESLPLVSGVSISYSNAPALTDGTVLTGDKAREDLLTRCNCTTGADNCPTYTYVPVYNQYNKIASFECVAQVVEADPTPFQSLNVEVSARAAPHRFYRADTGKAVDDIEDLKGTSVQPEGDAFSYNGGYLLSPNQEKLSMNAILGQFSVELDKALPAKEIGVQHDTTYVIRVNSAYYTPCTSCAKDSWFQMFSAHPPSTMGKGLQAIGHTVSRDAISTNTTNGNYEDTIFGRACWLPPTMVPFTHSDQDQNDAVFSNLAEQRQQRLKAQAALYDNGYQRDWFGFNKGSLIGSFDGVTWFSIGKARRVKSTSTKLFLAINAPFADLATNTSFAIEVIEEGDTEDEVAANYDYDPSLNYNAPEQTEGASCQKYHQCSNDIDCVTRLGWEYSCIDVYKYKTLWPKFDSNANELVGSYNNYKFPQILQVKDYLPGDSSKRCVYRGAGAPCVRNVNAFSDDTREKFFTCAPNFYCELPSQKAFNGRIMRHVGSLDGILLEESQPHLYGQDANVLGRPEYYIMPSWHVNAVALDSLFGMTKVLEDNAAWLKEGGYISEDPVMGICRPGKAITTTATTTGAQDRHKTKDSNYRTDYISQIGSCDVNSSSRTLMINNCPAFDMDTDSENYGNLLNFDNFNTTSIGMQNTCGGSSYMEDKTNTTFSNLEKKSLYLAADTTNEGPIFSPALALNACFRKAGAVCHTNLDCSPNVMHSEQALYFTKEDFGGREEEKKYWEENLICGQTEPVPYSSLSIFTTYNMSNNRCCRETGKDLTLYTRTPERSALSFLTSTSYDADLDNRYSRYSVLSSLGSGLYPYPTTNTSTQSLLKYQWNTLGRTAQKSCCGGGYIRKFADDSHDWTVRDRFKFDITNFRCLNYPDGLALQESGSVYVDRDSSDGYHFPSFTRDSSNYCKQLWPTTDGQNACVQLMYQDIEDASNPAEPINNWTYSGSTPLKSFDIYTSSFFTTYNFGYYATQSPYNMITAQNINDIYDMRFLSFVPFPPVPVPGYPSDFTQATLTADESAVSVAGTGGDSIETFKYYIPSYVRIKSSAWGADGQRLLDPTSFAVMFIYRKTPDDFNASSGDRVLPTPKETSSVRLVNCWQTNKAGMDQVKLNDSCFDYSAVTSGTCSGISRNLSSIELIGDSDSNHIYCWYDYDESNDSVEIVYRHHPTDPFSGLSDTGVLDLASFIFRVTPYSLNGGDKGFYPGDSNFYLERLSKLELLGIPQVPQAPVYCNSSQNKLIPNLYTIDTRTEAQNNDWFTNYLSTTNGYDNIGSALRGDLIDSSVDKIFSEETYTCCVELGEKVSDGDSSRCCSNYAVDDKCMLPPGTDLNVYFNPYVSSEALRSSNGFVLPKVVSGVVSYDGNKSFDEVTGEPTYDARETLMVLGQKYCENGTRAGGAFGYYPGEPLAVSIFEPSVTPDPDIKALARWSILDSYTDNEVDEDGNPIRGVWAFEKGFRWNNHIYCDDPDPT